MTTDPKPEQLKALADYCDAVSSAALIDRNGIPFARHIHDAARHLRAYAEQQAELAKWKLGCETNADCYREAVRAQDNQRLEIIVLKDQLAQRDARIKELEEIARSHLKLR